MRSFVEPLHVMDSELIGQEYISVQFMFLLICAAQKPHMLLSPVP